MEKKKYNTFTFEEKKEHSIRLNKSKKRMSKLKLHNYAKEFPEVDTELLYKVMNERAYSFETLDLIEKRLSELESFVTDIEQVKE